MFFIRLVMTRLRLPVFTRIRLGIIGKNRLDRNACADRDIAVIYATVRGIAGNMG